MAEVLFENSFLKETPLTSTKNKFILGSESGSLFCDEFTINSICNLKSGSDAPSRKRKLHSSYLESLTNENNALTSTVNKFLPKPPPLEKKEPTFKKKKKKKFAYRRAKVDSLCRRYRSHHSYSRSRSRSYEKSVLANECAVDSSLGYRAAHVDFMHEELPAGTARKSAPAFLRMVPDAASPAYSPTTPDYVNYRDSDYPESERSVPSEPVLCATGFAGNAANNFTFGAAPPPQSDFLFGNASFRAAPRGMQKRSLPGVAYQSSFIRPPTLVTDLFTMPSYNFESAEKFKAETFESFSFVDPQASALELERVSRVKNKKMQFLNITSMALIYNANLKNAEDVYRLTIQKYADEVKIFDPEFILKVALFSRQELHIRSASNFLLSYAAYHEETRPYLEKYFQSCIRLPSDWMEVAELYQVFSDSRLKNRSLPSALKKVMVKSFSKFDEYQLAKYNREKKASDTNGFTLKQLIRLLHLDSPANEIMCLLGKKYPETSEAFRKSKLPGIWDSRRAGQRMKLPVPETWETQISAHGNQPAIWEQLIDHSKLPYMAMLRNLRNLILSGISQKHHEKVLKHLKSKGAVINSRQTPLQFFEAFKVLKEIRDAQNLRNSYGGNKMGEPAWKKARRNKIQERACNTSLELVMDYEAAVSEALEISALYNLQPIPGKSLVICDLLFPSSLEKNRKNKIYNLCVMMGLMCLKACEDCKMNVICGKSSNEFKLLENYTFCESINSACERYEALIENLQKSESSTKSAKKVLEHYLKQHIILREKLDHVIVLRASGSDGGAGIKGIIKSFLHKYREVVNPELLYTDVDFLMSNSSLADSDSADGKDVYLGGSVSQLVKFIAERSSGGQLTYVENIDLKYELHTKVVSKKCKKINVLPEQEKLPVLTKVPKWHTVRVFISSTFKDMHSERDLLIRYVIPELRKRAASVFVKINEVDLRWGITEADCASKRASELCLLEAQKSDLFIGIVGARYGTIFDYDPPDAPELQWVKDYPRGLSITELEMHAGAFRADKLLKKKAFFYIRNDNFVNLMPEKYKSHFESEDPESKLKVEALKSTIRLSGLKVYDGYPCNFAGVLDNKPVLSGLENFGKTVLNDTWNAIKEMHEQDPYADDVTEEEMCQQELLHSFDAFVEIKNSPVENLVKEVEKQCGVFLVTGSPGSGKTTLVVDLLRKLKKFSLVKFFVGLSPRSTELSYMLQYISNSIARTFPVSSVFPKLTSDVMNHFPDILQEAVNSSGNADFVLVIDGLDHLSADDQQLDWLPFNLPQGLRLICSASDTSYAFKVLNEKYGVTVHANLPAFNQFDRENIVRQYLRLYGKSLDESSFNNQMLLLVTKKDSSMPLYLRIACDYLRSYASFENFTSILQTLPSSMPLLFQEIVLQMENQFGSVLVQSVLTLLSITKEGLDDADLHTLLTLVSLDKEKRSFFTFDEAIEQLKKLGPDNMLSQVTYCSLIHTVVSFAFGHSRFKKFSLIGSEFEKAVKKYYLNKNYSKFSKYMHLLLAAYYYVTCDSEGNGTWKGRSGPAFRGLIFHLFYGNCYQELSDYLCCLQFLETAFSVEASDLLLEYYSLLFEERRTGNSEAVRKIDFPLLSSFYDFVSRNLHIFQIYPDLVMQQALNEPSDSLVKLNLQRNDVYRLPIIECLSVSNHDPRIATLSGFFKNITASSCQNAASHALLGSEDGSIKVLDFPSKKIIRSVKSHSSAITCICSAGKNRICTASTDTTLSIWSTLDYSRISVMKGHKHIVSSCCSDSTSTILLSSGWDNTVRLWSLRDGSSISVINFECPVNCIDHHPTKQQVACGVWNGSIELWDTVSLEKHLTLSSICSSVKSIAYTFDGLNIIASYMNSDVTIWSSEQGLKISCLKGHVLPVKSIIYSPEGDKIISGSDDCTLKVWPADSGLSVCTFTDTKSVPISVLEIISPNHLAIGYQNSDIWVMDMSTGFATSKMSLESDLVSYFSRFDPDTYPADTSEESWVDISVVFGTKSGKIMVGNLQSSEITTVGTINARITAIVHNFRIIVCASSEGDIGLISYPEMNSKIVMGAHGGSVTCLNLFNKVENVWVISSGSDKVIKLWEIEYEELLMRKESFSKHYDSVTCCSSYPKFDDNTILTGSHDNNVILQSEYDSVTVYEGLKTSVVNIAFTDKYILGCGRDGSVAMWSEEGRLLSYISGVEQSSVVLSFRVDQDISGELDITLAFVDRDGSVKIRKPNQRTFSYSLEGHNRGITSCCTSESGEILSCSLDGTVNLWKIPEEAGDKHTEHLASITDICLSVSQGVILSSDAYGNIVIWKLSLSADNPLVYAGKKTYTGGFVKALSLLQEKKVVCAVTQRTDDGEQHFIDILYFDCSASDNNSIYSFQMKNSHTFNSEVVCLDASLKTETIVVGLKSGNFVIITANDKKTFNISDDWVLGVKLSSQSFVSPEFIFTSLLNGTVKRIQTEDALKNVDTIKTSMEEIQCPDFGNASVFISALCCTNFDNVYCGDSQGWLRRYSSSPMSKKIHDDSVTGITVCGAYVFSCSLDKTVKGWNSALNQVYLFHSSVPITCLIGCEMIPTSSTPTYILVIGTSSGAIQLLKFHDKKNN